MLLVMVYQSLAHYSHSSTLAWKIPWTERPGRLQSKGVAEGWAWLSDFTFTFYFSLSCIGEGNGNPLQCSCLENPRDGGAWWAAVYGVTQSRTRRKWLSSSSSSTSSLLFLSKFNPYLMLLSPSANQLSLNEMNVSSTQWYMLHGKYCLLNISAFLLWPSQPHLTSHCRETDKPLFCDNIRAKIKRKKWQKGRKKFPTICFFLNLL